jgi:hypothetical protein
MEKKMSDKRMTATEVLKQQKRIGDHIEIDLIEEIRKRHEEAEAAPALDAFDAWRIHEDRGQLLARVDELEKLVERIRSEVSSVNTLNGEMVRQCIRDILQKEAPPKRG